MFLLFQTIDFPQKFIETPTLVTTTKHLKDDANSRIDADNNAITEWIEVRICKRRRLSDEGLTLETSVLESLYGRQFT